MEENNNSNSQNKPPQDPSNEFNDDFDRKLSEALEKHVSEIYKKIDTIELENKKLKREKRSLEVIDQLKNENLDSALYDLVYDEDIEITNHKINILKQVIKKQVLQEIDAKFKKHSYAPPGGTNKSIRNFDLDDIIRKG